MKLVSQLFAGLFALVMTSANAQLDPIPVAQPGDAAFLKYRPVYHFLARKNWMNDPCGPYYDEDAGLYHMFYQSNPNATTWGNMTWGHAVSADHVTWRDEPNALEMDTAYDNLGVFSGATLPKNGVDGKTTIFYTGVTALPISWTLEYLHGEHVDYATTDDNGATWQKGATPAIANSPAGLNVTGWRDPYPFQSAVLDSAFGYDKRSDKESHYMLVAGGIHDVGPRIFLYHSSNHVDWKYKGYLLSQEKNTTFSEKYSGNWGYNFEMTAFMEIEDADGESHNVMVFGAEGSPRRYSMWAVGDISRHSVCDDSSNATALDEGLLQPKMVGVADHSAWYASSLYKDASGKYVASAWILEEQNNAGVQPQGWNGMLAITREVGIEIVRNIYDETNELTSTQGDWMVSAQSQVQCGAQSVAVTTIKTLGIKPIDAIELMRGDDVETVASVALSNEEVVLNTTAKSFELYAEVSSFEAGSKVGFQVRRSSEKDEYTTVEYDSEQGVVTVDRSTSCNLNCTEVASYAPTMDATSAPFNVYQIVDPATCAMSTETLKFRVFVDVSVVEVFVNDRLALSGRMYPCESVTEADGIALFSTGDAQFENVTVWANAKHAWADSRPTPTKYSV